MSIDLVIGLYDGFHHEGEIRMMNRISASVTNGVIVAIGSYRGQMDCALALHAQVPVYCIDSREGSASDPFPFGDEDRVAWMENVLRLGVATKVRPINMYSEQASLVWDKPIGLLFIDGSHDFESVMNDLKNWLEFVVSGGLVAFHDVTNPDTPGVAQAIVKYIDNLELIEECDLTQVYRFRPALEFNWQMDGGTPVSGEVEPPSVATVKAVTHEIDADLFEHIKAAPRHPSQKPKAKPLTRKKAK